MKELNEDDFYRCETMMNVIEKQQVVLNGIVCLAEWCHCGHNCVYWEHIRSVRGQLMYGQQLYQSNVEPFFIDGNLNVEFYHDLLKHEMALKHLFLKHFLRAQWSTTLLWN